MNHQKHIIKRQTISIGMAKSNSVGTLQDTIKQIYYDKIVPKLDILFSDLVPKETIVRIDKLDVDLGIIDKERIEQQIIERTLDNFERQLKEKLKFDAATENDVTIISLRRSVADEFIYFLEHGYFSWRRQSSEISVLEKALMEENAIVPEAINNLKKIIEKNPSVRDRLIFQFSDKFLQFLTEHFILDFHTGDFLKAIQSAIIEYFYRSQ